jgi:hypothetical protein
MDTIEHPLTGEKIRIAKADFSNQMEWEQANCACMSLGSGWRLPSIEELTEMYKNRDAIGGFIRPGYWSSTEVGDTGGEFCYYFNFEKGYAHGNCKHYDNSPVGHLGVRAVRNL